MKNFLLSLLLLSVFIEANEVSGFLKYMYADASNDDGTINKHSNVLGLNLSYLHTWNENFSSKVTFMGVVPILGDNSCSRVIGSRYSGVDSFTTLGEAFLSYEDDKNEVIIGRQMIDTPLLASNPTNMTNETFIHSGTFEALRYKREFNTNTSLDFSLISKYKHRTGSEFYDIGENITGDKSLTIEYIALLGLSHQWSKSLHTEFWALKADNLMSTFYTQLDYKTKFNNIGINFSIQGLAQSIDNASKNQTDNPSLRVDNSHLMGAKFSLAYKGSKLLFAASQTGDSQIILPWDGSPAFTKICVTSGMTRSILGLGLKKYAGAYSANTTAYKVAFIQNFSRFGLPQLKGVFAYAHYNSDAATSNQSNKIGYLKYDLDNILPGLSLAGAYTKIDNFNANTWTIEKDKSYEHYKLMVSYRF